MPILGQGIVPSGAAATELTAITRRAFLPTLTVQIYNSSPYLASLIASAQVASGGISPITVPIQGARMTTFAWGGYDASFGIPAQQNGIIDLEYNLKLGMVPVPFLGMEAAVQVDYAVVPRIEAVMNDAGNVMTDAFATSCYTNTSALNTQAFWGLAGLIDDGTNADIVGGQSRTAYTYLKSKVYAAGSVNPTRQLISQYINGAAKACGEAPTYGLMGFGTWSLLQQDFIGQEQYNITPGSSFDQSTDGPRSGFRALMVSGVPIFPDFYCPEGSLYLPNSRYLNLYLHEQGSFAFTGFESTLANGQLGYIGLLLTLGELITTKPSSMVRVSGLNYATL
jgi:hypothetical protein